MMIGNKICNFITLFRSPSQNQDDFQAFIDNLEINLETLAQENPFLMVVIGDFNAKSKHWCSQDRLISKVLLLNMRHVYLV